MFKLKTWVAAAAMVALAGDAGQSWQWHGQGRRDQPDLAAKLECQWPAGLVHAKGLGRQPELCGQRRLGAAQHQPVRDAFRRGWQSDFGASVHQCAAARPPLLVRYGGHAGVLASSFLPGPGSQFRDVETNRRFAVAVRPADVAAAVPEPQSLALVLLALGAGAVAWRRRPL